jgi:aspartate 1-decarboxylase
MLSYRKMLGSKIHRATITHANVDYEGSVTLPPELLKAADILPNEAVHIWNVTSGTRLETYAIAGVPGSRDICINGAAAHLMKPGDVVIIARFTHVPEEQCALFQPKVVFVDESNRIKEQRAEVSAQLVQALQRQATNRT